MQAVYQFLFNNQNTSEIYDQFAKEHQNKKINLDVNLANGSLKSKLRRANKINASHALIIGDDEITNECILIKYLDDELKEQELVKFDEAYEIYKLL